MRDGRAHAPQVSSLDRAAIQADDGSNATHCRPPVLGRPPRHLSQFGQSGGVQDFIESYQGASDVRAVEHPVIVDQFHRYFALRIDRSEREDAGLRANRMKRFGAEFAVIGQAKGAEVLDAPGAGGIQALPQEQPLQEARHPAKAQSHAITRDRPDLGVLQAPQVLLDFVEACFFRVVDMPAQNNAFPLVLALDGDRTHGVWMFVQVRSWPGDPYPPQIGKLRADPRVRPYENSRP